MQGLISTLVAFFIGTSWPLGIESDLLDPWIILPATAISSIGVLPLSQLIYRLLPTPAPIESFADFESVKSQFPKRRFILLSLLANGLPLAVFFFQSTVLNWPHWVLHRSILGELPVLREGVILIPFLVSAVLAWIPEHARIRRATGAGDPLAPFLIERFRFRFLLLLPPLLVLPVLLETVASLPFLEELWSWFPFTGWAFSLLVLCVIFALAPAWIRWVWALRAFPPGPVNDSLCWLQEQLLPGSKNLLLLWPARVLKVANAAAIGILDRLRMVLVTDTLVSNLQLNELHAVIAHELAHLRLRHVQTYLLLILSFMILLYPVVMPWVGPIQDPWTSTWTAIGIAILFWFGFFGYLSRRFESEADYAAARMVGTEAMVSALHKVAALNLVPPERGGWRHFSVTKRCALLRALERLPETRRRFLRQLSLLRTSCVALALAAVCSIPWILQQESLSLGPRLRDRELDRTLVLAWEDLRDGAKKGEEGQERLEQGLEGSADLLFAAARERYAAARESLERLHKARAYLLYVFLGLAECEAGEENREAAVEWFHKALDRNPVDPCLVQEVEARLRELEGVSK